MSEISWLHLTCPSCQTAFRIKSEYRHMRGRCPECNLRIPPPEPAPARQIEISHSDEPLGLVPLEEEDWPEPAQLLPNELDQKIYTLAAGEFGEKTSVSTIVAPAPPVSSTSEPTLDSDLGIFRLADEPKPSPAPLVPPPASRPKKQPDAEAERQAREEEADRNRLEKEFDSFLQAEHGSKLDSTATGQPMASLSTKITTETEDFFQAPEQKQVEVDPLFLDAMPAPMITPAPVPMPEPRGKQEVPIGNQPGSGVRDPLAEKPPEKTPSGSPSTVAAYGFSMTPEEAAAEKAPVAKSIESEPPPLAKPVADERAAAAPTEATNDLQMYKLSRAELEPERPEPQPEHLYFEGVWSLPFQSGNIGPWLWNSFGMMLIFFHLQLMSGLIANLGGNTGSNVASGLGLAGLGVSLIWIVVLLGSYFSMCFFNIVIDTSHRAKSISWPEGSWREWIWGMFKLVWLLALTMAAAYPFYWLFGGIGWSLGTTWLFPVVLFSSLISANEWFPLSAVALGRIALRGRFYFSLCLIAGILMAGVFYLSWWSFDYLITAPLMGLIWGAAGLIYARLLGRFGSLLYEEEVKPSKKKKKKKRRVKQEAGDNVSSDLDKEATPSSPPPS